MDGPRLTSSGRPVPSGRIIVAAVSILFFAATTWTSFVHWANFQYRTFDLAFYVQGVWQLIHGRFQVSVENVPLLGNHIEPIVFLFAPLLVLFRHPLLFVVVQNAGLAAMGPVAYQIGKRLGLVPFRAALVGVVILLTPATGYIALHEFHPEALAAPFLLLMIQARLSNSLMRHWIWFGAVLACKENMALLLVAYCVVQTIAERERGWAEVRKWYLWPLALALVWFLLCTQILMPVLNPGAIDYLALYDRLGKSLGDILRNFLVHPLRVAAIFFHAFVHGNLFWALVFPWFFLPLLRPRWLLIAAPILVQHFLSWRSSEWTIYFHYAAPLLPLFWIAAAEGLVSLPRLEHQAVLSKVLPVLLLLGSLAGQVRWGPTSAIASATADWFGHEGDRARKNAFLSQIPSQASVVAGFPYLSHFAMRERLYSLHYILKGLKTLSRQNYQPPAPTDCVFIDYADSATFDVGSGYYHPAMKTAEGRVIPSSDRLLHDFLKKTRWKTDSRNELTLMLNDGPGQAEAAGLAPPERNTLPVAPNTELAPIQERGSVLSQTEFCELELTWRFLGERSVFPWMLLRLSNGRDTASVTKGLCAPAAGEGVWKENWRVMRPEKLPQGMYTMQALFFDNNKRAWFEQTGGSDLEATLLAPPIVIGPVRVE